MRPVVKPALRRLWRDPQTLQLGIDPARALVLAGVDPPTLRLLDLLDGTRDRAGVLRAAAAAGCDPQAGRRLLDLLAGARALDDADPRPLADPPVDGRPPGTGVLPLAERERLSPDLASLSLLTERPGQAAATLRRRRAAVVAVLGAGRVGATLGGLLAAAGVGTVDVDDPGTAEQQDAAPGGLAPADAGGPRRAGARRMLARVAPSVRLDAGRPPDLICLCAAEAATADVLAAETVPRLYAEVRETTAVVGPLVLPGRSACRRCLELTRAERDPHWPRLAAQLAGGADRADACDVVLATLAAAVAALQALALLDGILRPATVDGTLELALPDWRLRRRSWAPHPRCGCHAAAAG